MIVMLVNVTVKSDQVEAFKTAVLSNASASRTEPGNLRFDVVQALDNPLKFVLIEVYRDEDARQAHFATDHYKEWKVVSGDFFSEKANILYEPLAPLKAESWEAAR
ncbi:MAG TPA: putative quinol monooxygenase [Phototrophicaceae bacterium]|nr:putative quinol monooxygenase [Phototrophicaceae bacterium]